MAEIELAVLARRAPSDRMPIIEVVQERVVRWQHDRNQANTGPSWHFA
ncbi:hypothetical protein [Ktedonosporobacter rubrisoli]|nr:hypothetical protein [Ktedonosporobacter rubrisoli]